MPEQKYVSIVVDEIIRQTEKAYLFEIDGEEVWIPKSQVEGDGDELVDGAKQVAVNITEWIAKEKDLDYY